MTRRRLDTLLAERGLVASRTGAAEAVRAGHVRVGRGGERPTKPSQLVPEDAELQVDGPPRYVSRGGIKLENALVALEISVEGRSCLDAGASNGGFTDCLLQRGASRVICVDVANGQLDWKLRNDERVSVLEQTNARELRPEQLPYEPGLVTADLSFISLTKVLPALARCMPPDGELLALVKPQFELGRQRVGRGGVVRDPADRRDALVAVGTAAQQLGFGVHAYVSSGLPGPKGNEETFVHGTLGGPLNDDLEALAREVEP